MELTGIPGVGKKTADALATLEDPERALSQGDVATLATAPGISPGRAARIARGAIRAEHDDDGHLLATDRARAVYTDVLELLKERAVTTYGKHRLETFYPATVTSRIEEVQERTRTAIDREPTSAMLDALADVKPLAEPRELRVRDRCLATQDAETYAAATDRVPELSVELIDDARELADLARGYTTVIALDESFAGLDFDGDVRVEPAALEEPATLVPERTLQWFARNRGPIEAAIAVHGHQPLPVEGDLEDLEAALDELGEDGEPVGDQELDRLRRAVDELDAAVRTAEHVGEDELREAIRNRDVTIEGTDLLSLVERGASVDSLLDHELADEYDAAVTAAREHLADALGLVDHEIEHTREVFPDHPSYPIASDDSGVSRLREHLQADRDARAAARKTDLARRLSAHRSLAASLVQTALERDVELAIARFARDFECTMPTFAGDGISIEGGRSPLLDQPVSEIDPVDYRVADVVLLSGVNSGGKTALLDLIACIVVLAHMGLPVPASSVRLQRFAGLHYYAATQGTLDAGAFEATLRQFGELAAGPAGRLILVDELESITEPGAAANIVAGILEELRGEATAVFVSHLAEEIRDAAGFDVRVDGIEAEGVVDGKLVVNRTPVPDYLARSTPELLVERLATDADADRAAFYERLLEKFDGN